ncbi:MAG: toxin [Candidatus Hydrogenedentes bacterium]|nr:toxin [Candidatus Hydrogenedentota bacterium]
MDHYIGDSEKNEWLKKARGISFEQQVVTRIQSGDLLGIYAHRNRDKYPNPRILAVRIHEYVYLVPFVETEEGRFLKTIIPSRKATKEYLGG